MNTIHELKVIVREFVSTQRHLSGGIHLVPMWYTGKPLKTPRYGNTGKNITDRDRQAMYNFYLQGVSQQTIAENYECSVAYVREMINTRPWLHPEPNKDIVNMTWWESDHSDPLELVKVFFPYSLQSLPDEAFEIVAQKKSDTMTWREYYDTVDWADVYRNGSASVEAVHEEVERRAALEGINLTFR